MKKKFKPEICTVHEYEHTKENENAFCEALTNLLHKYGYGIADEPPVYWLENNDYTRKCSIDKNGLLLFK